MHWLRFSRLDGRACSRGADSLTNFLGLNWPQFLGPGWENVCKPFEHDDKSGKSMDIP
jgi:hypothetical protein